MIHEWIVLKKYVTKSTSDVTEMLTLLTTFQQRYIEYYKVTYFFVFQNQNKEFIYWRAAQLFGT